MRLRQRAKSIKIPIKRTHGGMQKPYVNVSYTEKKIEYIPKKDKQTWYNAVKDIYYQKLFSFILFSFILYSIYHLMYTLILVQILMRNTLSQSKINFGIIALQNILERHYEPEQTFLFRQIEQLINKSKKSFSAHSKSQLTMY